jgi:carboxymethylenebutenolidase
VPDIPLPDIRPPFFLALPAAPPPWPGVVVIHEGGGISAQLLRFTERLAAEGYAACAPDVFFRTGGPEAADFMTMIGAVTPEQLRADLAVAIGRLRDAGATSIGVTGFCMGGLFTYRAALWARELGVAAAVGFYGGGIARELGDPACPTLLFFGGRDEYIPTADIDAVLAHHDDAVIVYDDAEHGFMRDGSANYHEQHASDAWKRMLDFFAEQLR